MLDTYDYNGAVRFIDPNYSGEGWWCEEGHWNEIERYSCRQCHSPSPEEAEKRRELLRQSREASKPDTESVN